MFEPAISLDDLDAAAALAAAVERRQRADVAEAELLAIAAHWADLHPVLGGDPDGFRVPGMEQMVPLAGEGTPEVAEFAPAELAAALGISTYAGQQLVGDALELRHLLPRGVGAGPGRDPAGVAGSADRRSHPQPVPSGGWVGGCTGGAVRAQDRLGPDPGPGPSSPGPLRPRGRRPGRHRLRLHDRLHRRHPRRPRRRDRRDVRRARAVGVIADPQGALDLLTTDAGSDGDGDGDGGSAVNAGGRQPVNPNRNGKARVTLYVHLHEDAIIAGSGLGRVEGLGPVTVEKITDWVGRSDLTIKPVLDLNNRASVDAYEVPDRMAETVLLRNPCCPFPWCTNRSRNKDTDHVRRYVAPGEGGLLGQTTAHNLAPPCRRHHRLKTHGGWSYSMPEPGTYLWRSPAGRRYLVDHTGTTALARPLPHTA